MKTTKLTVFPLGGIWKYADLDEEIDGVIIATTLEEAKKVAISTLEKRIEQIKKLKYKDIPFYNE
jgi:hypothetical protein